MTMTIYNSLIGTLLMNVLLTPNILSKTVTRLSSGDVFEAPSCVDTCWKYNGKCEDKSVGTYGCCYKCKCTWGGTLYGNMCFSNLPQEQLQCEIFVEKDEYYGLKTHRISKELTYLGYIKDKWYWNRKVFRRCTIDDQSTYWDTNRWTELFSGGRLKSDFHFDGNSEGVLLRLQLGGNRWKLYIGLLIKLSTTCYSYNHIPHFETLQNIEGIRGTQVQANTSQNGHYTLTSCLVIKFAGQRSYYEHTISPPITFRKESSKMQTTTVLPNSTVTSVHVQVSTKNCEDWLVECKKLSRSGGCVIRKSFMETYCCKTCHSSAITVKPVSITTNVQLSSIKTEVMSTKEKIQSTNKDFTEYPGTLSRGTTPKTHSHITDITVTMKKSIYSKVAKTITPVYVKGKHVKTVYIATTVLVALLIVIFCVSFIFCYRRKASHIIITSYGSYDFTDSGSLLNSNEYAIIEPPTYSDIRELENWGKNSKRTGYHGMEKQSEFWNGGACNTSISAVHESMDGKEQASERWNGILFINQSDQ